MESSIPPSSRTSLFERSPSEKSGELEVYVHVVDEGQELVLMKEGRIGEQQNQVVVEEEEQEKGKRVDPVSSSPPPPQQHSPAQQH